ncbi:MAG TPA: AMP-binding protein [Pseudolabrys sp.]|nr:AMP-binding protein [Pseudolabrys sp.]
MMDKKRDRQSPETLQALARNLALAGDRDAVISFAGEEMRRRSFRVLAAEVESRARILVSEGIGAGDPVILCGPGGADWIVACLAILRCGACAVPLDTHLSVDTFRYVLKDSDAQFALVAASTEKRLGAIFQEVGIEVLPLDGRCALHTVTGEDFPTVGPGDRAILFYTSGTTGPPKGVPLTHRNIAFQIRVIAHSGLVSADDRVLLPLPLHHVYPLVIGVLTPLALDIAVVLPDGFTGTRILAALKRGEATLMIGVPRLYDTLVDGIAHQMRRQGLAASSLFAVLLSLARLLRRAFGWRVGKVLFAPIHRRFGPSLRTVASGGAALKPKTARTLEALGWQVGTGYGLTETSPMLTMNPPGETRFETAGRPISEVELRIDRDEGKNAALGEVLARGPGVFAGYHHLPEKTKEAFTQDGWFRTGDLGLIDAKGWLHLAGRRTTLIVTAGGKNVQPEQVEDAYQAHPVIAEIAVFERDGHVAGLIVPDPAQLRTGNVEEAVREAVHEVSRTLPSYQRLAEYRLTREAIPRTRLGKPRIHLIAERYRRAGSKAAESAAKVAEPVPIDEFSGDDQALLENEAAHAAFQLLVERFAGRRVTPDSDFQIDLGVDSIEWLDLSLELAESTGVTLREETIADLQTVRDLLIQLAHSNEDSATGKSPLEDPEGALDERQRRWLQPKGPIVQRVGRIVAAVNRFLMRALFQLRVTGTENLPARGPFVLASNHPSYLDPFALAAALRTDQLERLYWAGWTGVVFAGPVRRAFARVAQAVPVDPDRATASSLAFGGAVLKRGLGLVWFPEGERWREGRLQPFKLGLGLVLDRWRVPVIPVVIRGTYTAWPSSRRLPRLRPVRVDILAPVHTAELAAEGKGGTDAERIVDALHRRIADALAED